MKLELKMICFGGLGRCSVNPKKMDSAMLFLKAENARLFLFN